MTQATVAPFGSWRSPISSDIVSAGSRRLGHIVFDGDDLYWSEGRPSEGGRDAIMRLDAEGSPVDLIPAPFSARSRVHEYGGAGFTVNDGIVYFCNFDDQRLYRKTPGEEPAPISPEGALRYADLVVDGLRSRLVAICEDHSGGSDEPVNSIVTLALDGGDSVKTLVAGRDFYAAPRLSPDGLRMAWLTWDHPNMPWDGCELWAADLSADGSIENAMCIAGGPDEAIFQPSWSPGGVLHFISDRGGWWNLYRAGGDGLELVFEVEADLGEPAWVFGLSRYGFASEELIVCIVGTGGRAGKLALWREDAGLLDEPKLPFSEYGMIQVQPGRAAFFAGSGERPIALVDFDLAAGEFTVIRQSTEADLDPGFLSIPRSIEFATSDGDRAHARYYPPRNDRFRGPGRELPPLLVKTHGGPTSAAPASLSLGIQYWTSRGFAVLDVDYRGSSGYGRAYRRRLEGKWGIYDVDDCVAGADYLVSNGEVDGDRLAIDGGSAGGFTTLAALTFRDRFKAGASLYGVGDLESLARDTHKFESRYLDRLVAPYPERRDLYLERSPVHHTDRLSVPVILFQGLDDKVVPPSQAEAMVEALRSKGLPVAYVAFEGEGHGFRRAENIKRVLDAELYFYSRIFGFELAEPVEPVAIENL